MMTRLLKGVLAIAVRLSERFREGTADLLKIHAAIYYIRGVQTVRRASRVALLALGLLAMMGAGLLILPLGAVALVYGLGGGWLAAGVTLLVLGGVYVVVPVVIYRRCMSERAWMSLFRGDDIVARVTNKRTDEQSSSP